jgi:hypothetical protein
MKRLLACLAFVAACAANANELDPMVEYRVGSEVVRDASGSIKRSAAVLRAFQKRWACPSTGMHSGACPGWAIDHVVPLSCGGLDAVSNLQWLPDQIKSAAGEYAKDRFERRVYGGDGMSKGCP